MCGICGYISRQNFEEELIHSMNDTFVHRGPDGEGYYFSEVQDGYNISLAHKRLSIIDLSSNGRQPMLSEDENIVVTFNGEIYNYLEIKKELIQKKYVFSSTSDTEVIIYAYKEWGINCVEKFNGMFAFCLVDKKNGELYLVRDRIGKKPLYFYQDNYSLCFASDLKAITKFPGFKKELNQHALGMYLWNQYIVAPHTIYEKVYKLEQGSILKFKNGSCEINKFWDLYSVYNHREIENKSFQECKSELEALLHDAVNKRMISSDVPVGVFLSGGIDSSLVAAIAQQNCYTKIDTFSIGFYEGKYNEANFAKEIAGIIGSNHHEQYLHIKDALNLVREVPKYFTEPFADNSQLPMMLLSKFARTSITVALSGDGGDELFCGYDSYEQVLKLKKSRVYSFVLHKVLKNFTPYINGNKLIWRTGKFINAFSEENILILDYITALNITGKLLKQPTNVDNRFYQSNINTKNIQEKRMLLDMDTYLTDDIMAKVDRATMAYSLEARSPFLDYRVIEKSFITPFEYKYKEGTKKIILKDILCNYIPCGLVDRPKKGFGVPLSQWLHSDFSKLIDEFFDEKFLIRQDIFQFKQLQQFIMEFRKNNSVIYDKIMWSLLMFQLWYQENM